MDNLQKIQTRVSELEFHNYKLTTVYKVLIRSDNRCEKEKMEMCEKFDSCKTIEDIDKIYKETTNAKFKIENEMYYIQNGYVGNAIMWWCDKSKGYTSEFSKAGKYTKDEAESIITRDEDRAWPCSYVDANKEAKKLIIDGQYLDNDKLLPSLLI